MTDPSRFRLIQGDDAIEEARRADEGLSRYGCSKCSDETGLPYDQLMEVFSDAQERNGQLAAAQKWLACRRCGEKKFNIGTFIAEH